jgi:hypothetical protein
LLENASGDDCTCACEGKHHGKAQHASWLEVGETTLVGGEGKKVVTRVLERSQAVVDKEARFQEELRKLTGQ